MSLDNKTADVFKRQFGWYVSEGFADADVGAYGTKDGNTFEYMDTLSHLGHGVPDPKVLSEPRQPTWFMEEGASHGGWQVGGKLPGGKVSLSIKLEFKSNNTVACFLSSYDERWIDNGDAVGDAIVKLYRESGHDWRLTRKWVARALRVTSGFVMMSLDKDVSFTLSGSGKVNVSGVPVEIDVAGFQQSATSSVEFKGLAGVAPFLKLAEVYDRLGFNNADWHPIG